MSNLLAVRVDARRASELAAWMEPLADPQDVVQVPLADGASLVLVTREAERTVVPGEAALFRGFAVDTELEHLAVGADGWAAAPTAMRDRIGVLGGTFVHASWHDARVEVRRDVWGNQRLLRTAGDGWSAASDSMLVLRRLRDAMREPSTPDEVELLARTVLSGVAETALGPGTAIREIAFVPAGHGVELAPGAARLVGDPVGALLRRPAAGYRDAVRAAAAGIAGEIGAVRSLAGTRPRLRLSGGQDSRVALAAALAQGGPQDLACAVQDETEAHRADARVARDLAARFRLELEVIDHPDRRQQLRLWLATLADTYDGFGVDDSAPVRGVFGISGIGAETCKGNFGWRSWWRLEEDLGLPLQLDLAFVEQSTRGLAQAGASAASPEATEDHYLAYRAGIHCGAGYAGRSPLTANPLQRADLVRLGRAPWSSEAPGAERARIGDPLVITDLAALLHPEAAMHPYDRDIGVDAAHVERRLEVLGGAVDVRDRAYATTGDALSVPLGPSSLALALAEREEPGAFDLDSAIALGARGVRHLEHAAARARYEEILENARWRAEERGIPLMFAGQSPARYASLVLLD